jgi:hypothetical protein
VTCGNQPITVMCKDGTLIAEKRGAPTNTPLSQFQFKFHSLSQYPMDVFKGAPSPIGDSDGDEDEGSVKLKLPSTSNMPPAFRPASDKTCSNNGNKYDKWDKDSNGNNDRHNNFSAEKRRSSGPPVEEKRKRKKTRRYAEESDGEKEKREREAALREEKKRRQEEELETDRDYEGQEEDNQDDSGNSSGSEDLYKDDMEVIRDGKKNCIKTRVGEDSGGGGSCSSSSDDDGDGGDQNDEEESAGGGGEKFVAKKYSPKLSAVSLKAAQIKARGMINGGVKPLTQDKGKGKAVVSSLAPSQRKHMAQLDVNALLEQERNSGFKYEPPRTIGGVRTAMQYISLELLVGNAAGNTPFPREKTQMDLMMEWFKVKIGVC